jgi:hypothetical protein
MTGTILETVYPVSIAFSTLAMTYLLNNAEAVCVVSLKIAGTHEREDRHDVMQYSIGDQSCQFRRNEQSALGCPGVGRGCVESAKHVMRR